MQTAVEGGGGGPGLGKRPQQQGFELARNNGRFVTSA